MNGRLKDLWQLILYNLRKDRKESPSTQSCVVFNVTSHQYLSFTVRFDVSAGFDIKGMFSHSSAVLTLNLS